MRYDGDADFAFHPEGGDYLMRSGDAGTLIQQNDDGRWGYTDADGNFTEGTGFVTRTDDLARPGDPGTLVMGASGDEPAAAGADVDTPFTVTEYDNGDVGIGLEGGKTMVIEGGADFEYAREDGDSVTIDGDGGDIVLSDGDGNSVTRTGEGGTSYLNADGSAGAAAAPDPATGSADGSDANVATDPVLAMLAAMERSGTLTPELADAIAGALVPGVDVQDVPGSFAPGALPVAGTRASGA